MASSSRKHSIEELIGLKWLLGALMGLVCVTTLFNIPGQNPIPAIMAAVAIGAGVIAPSWVARVPQWAWKVYAVAIIPLVLLEVVARDTIPALLDLNTWLVLFRALNHTKRREQMQLVLLCLFLVIMTGILTASLLFGFQLLLFAGLAVGYLLLGGAIEYKAEGDYDRIYSIEGSRRVSIAHSLRSLLSARLGFLGIIMLGGLVGIASMIFVVIPRIDVEEKVNLFKMKTPTTFSGFSDRVELGEVTEIKNDNSIALRVDAEADAVAPVMPYWRMLALDRYENGAFSLSPALAEFHRSPLSSPYHSIRYWPDKRFANAPSDRARDRWTFFLEPGVSRFLPVLGSFEQMTIGSLNDLAVDPLSHSFALKDISTKVISYQIEGVDFSGRLASVDRSLLPAFPGRGRENPNAALYPETLGALPVSEAGLGFLQRESAGFVDGRRLSASAFSREAVDYLWERHDYSMSVTLPRESPYEDPVLRWMDSDLPGHCEFFASAFTLLARANGFKARVVVGFKGGTWNAYENYFMIRNADAHAWCEILDEEGMWLRVDPTPGSPMAAAQPLMQNVAEQVGESSSMAFVDSLRILWYRRVVNFDETAQREAAIQLKDFFLAYAAVAERWAVGAYRYAQDWFTSPWSVWRILYLCFLASLLVGAIAIERRMALNFRELLLAPFRRGDPIRRKAGKLLKRCGRAGAAAAPERAEVLRDLQRLRFGPKETWPSAGRVFKAARRLR